MGVRQSLARLDEWAGVVPPRPRPWVASDGPLHRADEPARFALRAVGVAYGVAGAALALRVLLRSDAAPLARTALALAAGAAGALLPLLLATVLHLGVRGRAVLPWDRACPAPDQAVVRAWPGRRRSTVAAACLLVVLAAGLLVGPPPALAGLALAPALLRTQARSLLDWQARQGAVLLSSSRRRGVRYLRA